jgi:hypothetical protein
MNSCHEQAGGISSVEVGKQAWIKTVFKFPILPVDYSLPDSTPAKHFD